MVSPLRFIDSLCISECTPEMDAEFTAYLDIQLDVPTKDFVLPLEQEIVDWLDDKL